MADQLEKEKQEKKSFWQWVKEHKKLLITLGIITVTTGVVTFITIKNWDAIKQLFSKKVTTLEDSKKVIEEVTEKTIKEVPPIPEGVTLTGKKLTARELGNEMGVSAQEINKRLVNKGMQVKSYDNEYGITPFGDQFGDSKWKVTKAGHSFVNNEWDECVLNILFTEEERLEHIRKMEYARATRPTNLG